MSMLDAIELEVLRNALTAAAAEMDVTMWRTSRSTIVREMLDYSTAIFDANGNNVAQSARIPQHLNSMGYFLQTILDRFIPADLWEEGDVIISNDPYCGGQHLPDIAAFRRCFPKESVSRSSARSAIISMSAACHPAKPRRECDRNLSGGAATPALQTFRQGRAQ